MNQQERNRIEQVDRYINGRQNDKAGSLLPQRPEPEGLLIDGLINQAVKSQPDPAFVNALEQRLRQIAATKTIGTPWYQRFPPLFQLSIRLAAVGLAILFVLLGTLFIRIPTAQATIWAWLYGFGLIDRAKVEQQPMPVTNPVIPADRRPTMNLAEIRQRAPFAVLTPSRLPAPLQFVGGFVVTTTQGAQVSLVYQPLLDPNQTPMPTSPLLLLVITRDVIEGLPLLPTDQTQPTVVQGVTALYVHGSWRGDQAPQNPARAQLTWDATLDANWLSWRKDGISYLLYSQELGIYQAEMVQMAESLE